MPRTAAALIIGNELLTGKIQDQNLSFLARELFSLGIVLRRVVFCPDERDVIVADLDALRDAHDLVFTSGGVGPTHDDITIEAVATAFGRRVVRSEEVEGMIRAYWGDAVTPSHLRMADMPEGARLIRDTEVPWPTVVMGNVYVLPGVPRIFQLKLEALRTDLGADAPFVSQAVYTSCDEAEIAERLHALVHDHPSVSIGSYPRLRGADHRVKVTFDGQDPHAVHAAAEALVAALPAETIVRRDGRDDGPYSHSIVDGGFDDTS